MSDRPNKLFHVLVVVGASLTGTACGGATASESVDQDAARDAAQDAKDAKDAKGAKDVEADYYVGISPPPCGANVPGAPECDAGYPQISPNQDDGGLDAYAPILPPPLDSGASDGYPQIAPNLDGGYPLIH